VACEQFERHYSEAPHVYLAALVSLLVEDFGGGVVGSADACRLESVRTEELRKAEISDFDNSTGEVKGSEQDVVGLMSLCTKFLLCRYLSPSASCFSTLCASAKGRCPLISSFASTQSNSK